MQVRKRSGVLEPVSFDKILTAVSRNSAGLNVDPAMIALKAINAMFDGITTRALDEMCARACADQVLQEPDYAVLGGRILCDIIAEEVSGQGITGLEASLAAGRSVGLVALDGVDCGELAKVVDACKEPELQVFGAYTVYERYLLKHPVTRLPIETPKQWLARVALGVSDSQEDAYRHWLMMMNFRALPSTPTLFNSGTTRPQMSSCFLLDSPEDSLEGIYKSITDVARLSKFSGGIAGPWTRVRSHNSPVKGTNGQSNGIVPWLKILDASVAAVDQGSKRKGASCVYLDTWHADIEDFLELRSQEGDINRRTFNLNTANWIPDEFMRRVEADRPWTLFDPVDAPNLTELWGPEFDAEYARLEAAGLGKRQVQARALYEKMMKTLSESGNGWMCFRDAANRLGNQTALPGNVVHSSNLCVAPETQILVRDAAGVISTQLIWSMADQETEVWNGSEWSKVTVRKTSEAAELITVNLSHEGWITCTPYHKFPIVVDGHDCRWDMIDAGRLQPGMILKPFDMPEGHGHDKIIYVKSLERRGRVDSTYCFTEPKRHLGTFNGVVTGQCVEIVEVSDRDNTAVCNLASVNISKYVDSRGYLDAAALGPDVEFLVRQLDNVIDRNMYQTQETARSNPQWRPVGLGVMGLADAFAAAGMAFGDERSRALNAEIFERVYFHALTASAALAAVKGPCPRYPETRSAQGRLHHELMGVEPRFVPAADWAELKAAIAINGLRNSLLVAVAPTATIALIAGCSECVEPMQQLAVRRETMSGDFIQVQTAMVRALQAAGCWTPEVIDQFKRDNGSLAKIAVVPQALRDTFKTAFEISQKTVINMAAERMPWIDQSQSLNLFLAQPTIGQLSSMYMHAWKSGLKTTYYLRRRPPTEIAKAQGAKPVAVQAPVAVVDAEVKACLIADPNCEACQ